ncbi:kinase-like domain-containing protein [Rhodofomes roseus]|uniref:Kinase-like domain-containing protein n=1 Tax=Rhodofomes roseus TaxID=34475 RepID=A0ABQ8K1D3_9APHY|nr:kinase-like domain-containing protein [Rhodofomes roseus]KAH9830528.1 kinase-like domain-containing protein [Rhodofomes roseus]
MELRPLPGAGGRPKPDYAPSSIDHLTDEEVIHLVNTRPEQESGQIAFGDDNIFRVAHDIVGKYAQDQYRVGQHIDEPSEALTLDLVFQHTTIPVPRVRRVIRNGDSSNDILMDYIPGRQLSVVWPTMSVEEQLRIVFTLRGYVRQLQAIRHPRSAIPGPVAPGNEARISESPIWGNVIDQRGPFADYSAFCAWFDKAQEVAQSARQTIPWLAESSRQIRRDVPLNTLMGSTPLVLCHQDLNMRNILVGDDGRLWLIDWAWSGFYPPWFEYIAMKIQAEHEEQSVTNREEPFWDLMIPFICGPYYREERWLNSVSLAFMYKFERARRTDAAPADVER